MSVTTAGETPSPRYGHSIVRYSSGSFSFRFSRSLSLFSLSSFCLGCLNQFPLICFFRSSCGLWRIQPGENDVVNVYNFRYETYTFTIRWSSQTKYSPSIGRTKNGRCCKKEPKMEIKKKELASPLAVISILPSSSLLLIGIFPFLSLNSI